MDRGEFKKRGQIYLIAAIIIVVIIAGFITIANYSKKESPIRIYDLGEELGIESANILEYGTAQGFDNNQMENLLTGFIGEYAKYGNIERLYFIFGNMSNVSFVGYQEFISEPVYLTVSEVEYQIFIEAKKYTSTSYPNPSEIIKIKIQDLGYEFKLREGENFYFIIFQEVGGEQYVIQGGNRDDEE